MLKIRSPWIQDIKIKALNLVDKEYTGNTPPTVFVGSKFADLNKANVGILSPLENKEEAWKYDDPYHWYNNNYNINKIIELRANLINARKNFSIFEVRNSNKFLDLAQEIAMSFKPSTIEVELEKKLKAKINLDNIHLPFGPGGEAKKIEATENIKVNQKIEKVYYDTDLKSAEAIIDLNKIGIPEYKLSQILSIGITGLKYNRKLVPTRWSITATDDILGKNLIKEIKNYNTISNYRILFGNYFGNYYLIFLFPDAWSYELFESSMPDQLPNIDHEIYTMTDYENYYGRKTYADNTVGGYYAARLSLLEYLRDNKIQASALLLRFVTSEYSAPLGVFVVRQAVRKTISSQIFYFNDKKIMLEFGKNLILRKFGYNVDNLLKKSILLNNINKQRKIFEFT
ncbi:hypothetical protein J4440_02820 [Candidatus Woesearchaeota archaeon]|nr:hypothetical protein [Candidatus Woesearchaeota archaeon]